MNTYATGYPWKVAIDLSNDDKPLAIGALDTVQFVHVPVNGNKIAMAPITCDLTAEGSAIGIGRVVIETPDTVTAVIPPGQYITELKVTIGGSADGPYYSEPFEVKKGNI